MLTPVLTPKVFSQEIINMAIMAYNTGLLQFNSMSIGGIEISMDMKSKFNYISAKGIINGEFRSTGINIYTEDAQHVQEYGIEMIINALFNYGK